MDISALDHEKVLSMLPDRPDDSHKGSFGGGMHGGMRHIEDPPTKNTLRPRGEIAQI